MEKLFKMMSVCVVMFFLYAPLSYGETVKIIAEDDWYPYSANVESKAKGIAVDIVRAAYKAEGLDVEFEVMNYDRGMGLVKDGKAIGCFDAPRTKEIEGSYLWHDESLFSADSYFYAAADYSGEVNSVKDLVGKTIGLTQGYGYGDTIDLNKNLIKEYSKSDEVILKKLMAKRVDVIILFDKVADNLISKLGIQGQVKQVGRSDSNKIFVAFSKTHPDGKKYCDIFSTGFGKIKADGTYQQIMDQWEAQLKGSAGEAASK